MNDFIELNPHKNYFEIKPLEEKTSPACIKDFFGIAAMVFQNGFVVMSDNLEEQDKETVQKIVKECGYEMTGPFSGEEFAPQLD